MHETKKGLICRGSYSNGPKQFRVRKYSGSFTVRRGSSIPRGAGRASSTHLSKKQEKTERQGHPKLSAVPSVEKASRAQAETTQDTAEDPSDASEAADGADDEARR